MAVAGQQYVGPYRLLSLTRTGATCQVWEAMYGANQRCALKTLQKEHRKKREEVNALRRE